MEYVNMEYVNMDYVKPECLRLAEIHRQSNSWKFRQKAGSAWRRMFSPMEAG